MITEIAKRVLPRPVKKVLKEALWVMERERIERFLSKGGLPGAGEKLDSLGDFDWRAWRRFRRELFPETSVRAWLDEEGSDSEIDKRLSRGTVDEKEAEHCRYFSKHGYVVAQKVVPDDVCYRAWESYWSKIQEGKIPRVAPLPQGKFLNTWGRLLNVHQLVPELDGIFKHPSVTRLASLLLGRPSVPFQTIPSYFGSEQPVHSDAIHMTTYPLGFMVAAWIALEDIDPQSGPLIFYPGSHRHPYRLCHEAGIAEKEYKTSGRDVYVEKYEPFVGNYVAEKKLQPAYFAPAKKGDVLFWHHNLIHGGSSVKDTTLTRKSLVCHYFAKGVVCYHDLSGDGAGDVFYR